jgi:hypothetical protein
MARHESAAARKVGQVMHEFKQGELKSGSTGKPVKSRRQAIAIGLSEARAAGAKLPGGGKGSKSGKAAKAAGPSGKGSKSGKSGTRGRSAR